MEQNYLNVKFVSSLLEQIIIALNIEEHSVANKPVPRWGCCDDFIYSEVLSKHFTELLPCERKALMQIIRTTINASAEAYFELLEDNYLYYEDLGESNHSLNEFVDKLKVDNNDY